MLEMLRQRRERDEDGFTLIELMVVVLIIAILIAIAIPTFLGAQNRARDRAAQSDIRNALTAAKTVATDFEGYFKRSTNPDAAIDASTMASTEGALTYTVANPLTDPGSSTNIVFGVKTDFTSIAILRKSASGKYFGLTATKDGVVIYCKADAFSATTFNVDATTGTAGCATKW